MLAKQPCKERGPILCLGRRAVRWLRRVACVQLIQGILCSPHLFVGLPNKTDEAGNPERIRIIRPEVELSRSWPSSAVDPKARHPAKNRSEAAVPLMAFVCRESEGTADEGHERNSSP